MTYLNSFSFNRGICRTETGYIQIKIKPRSVYKWSDAYSEVYSKLDEKMNAYSGVIIKGKPFK